MRCRTSASASTSFRLSTAMRTIPAPASRSASAWAAVASTSWVWVAHMLCTTIGWWSPTVTFPTRTRRVEFRSVMGGMLGGWA